MLFAEENDASGRRCTFEARWSDVWARIKASDRPLPLYEVLRGGPCRCLYLDVEWMGEPDDSVPIAIARDADAALQRVRGARSVRKHFFQACGNGKASYHVHLVLSVPFASPPHAGDFVRSELLPKWHGKLDGSPYGRRQCWRLPLCAKASAPDRPLQLLGGASMTWEVFEDCRVDTGIAPDPVPSDDPVLLPAPVLEHARRYFNYRLCEHRVHEQNNLWILPTTQRECPYARRAHHSNHVYAVVDPRLLTWRVKCRNERCMRAYREMPATLLPRAARQSLLPPPHQPGGGLPEPPAWLASCGLDFWRTDERSSKEGDDT